MFKKKIKEYDSNIGTSNDLKLVFFISLRKQWKRTIKFREHHTRKNERSTTNGDLIHMLLVTSDSYLFSIITIQKLTNTLANSKCSLLILCM